MTNDFVTDIPQLQSEDEYLGTGIQMKSEELQLSDLPKYYRINKKIMCTRCKKGIHNIKTNTYRCKGGDCECLCRIFYEGLDGKLRKYSEPDDSFQVKTKKQSRTKTDDDIDKINKLWKLIKHGS